MRVIAGSARGRKLQVPPGTLTRPTPARVREALFSILGSHLSLAGARVLDLFAGSGALGIEALSRGAAHATFVEAASPALHALRHNLRPFAGDATLLPTYVERALSELPAAGFDLIFLDPPYDKNLLPEILPQVVSRRLLAADGRIACEHAGAVPPEPLPAGLPLCQQRRYGSVGLTVLSAAVATP